VFDRQGVVRDVVEGIMFADEFDKKVRPLLSTRTVNRVQKAPMSRKPRKETTATIVVGTNGYQPSNIRLRLGVPARLTFIRNTEQTCGTEIVIPAYKVNRPLPLNVPVVVRFTPRRSGRYKFTCGMNMFRGALVVR
jgi:plastocyanin domain-containing protein